MSDETERKPTDPQLKVMECIQGYFFKHGRAPTMSQIGDECEMSKSRVHAAVTALCELRYLMREFEFDGDGGKRAQRRGLRILKHLPDRFEEAAKAACAAGGIGPDKLPAVRDAITQTLTRAA